MATNIYQYNGTLLATVPDGALNTTAAPIAIPGKGYTNYGAPVMQDVLWTMQNFAGTQAPAPLLQGVMWYDTNTSKTKIYTGSSWSSLFQDNQTNLPNTDNVYDMGSSTYRWSNMYAVTFNGVATSAQYADVAERYESDCETEPGDLVRLGGSKEITKTASDATDDVFGVVSTKPAVMMNSNAGEDSTHPYVALLGRVPCKVVGTVSKGQRLVSSDVPGVARGWRGDENPLSIIGRALEAKETTDLGLVEIVIGRW
jgi:hypothetical protein